MTDDRDAAFLNRVAAREFASDLEAAGGSFHENESISGSTSEESNSSSPSVSDRTPQTSIPEAGKALPTQDLRSLDQSDPTKVSKAHPSKDPISQVLASSEQSATQSGPDRRSIPVLSGEVSSTGPKTGPSPSAKETNSEQPPQRSDRDSQPAPIRADSPGSGSRENSGPKLLDKSLENGPPANKSENLNKPSIPDSSQFNSAGLPKIGDLERSIKRNSDTDNPDSSVGKSGNPGANSAPPSNDRGVSQVKQSKNSESESLGIKNVSIPFNRNDFQNHQGFKTPDKSGGLEKLEKLEKGDSGLRAGAASEGPISKALRTEMSGEPRRLESNTDMFLTKETNRFFDKASPKNDKSSSSGSPMVRLELPKEMRGSDGPLGLIMENTKGLRSLVLRAGDVLKTDESKTAAKSETSKSREKSSDKSSDKSADKPSDKTQNQSPRILGFSVFSDPTQTIRSWQIKLGLAPDTAASTRPESGLKAPNQVKGDTHVGKSQHHISGVSDSATGQNRPDSNSASGKTPLETKIDNLIYGIQRSTGQTTDKAPKEAKFPPAKDKNSADKGNQVGDRTSETAAGSQLVRRQFGVKAVEIVVDRLGQLGDFGNRILFFLNGKIDSKDASAKTPVTKTPVTKTPEIAAPNTPFYPNPPDSKNASAASSEQSSSTKSDTGDKTVIVQDLVRELFEGLPLKTKPEIKLHLPDGTYGGQQVDRSQKVAPLLNDQSQESETLPLQAFSVSGSDSLAVQGQTKAMTPIEPELNQNESQSGGASDSAVEASDSAVEARVDSEIDAQSHSQANASEHEFSYLTKEGDTADSVSREILLDQYLAPLLLKLNPNHLLAQDSRQFKPGIHILLPTPAQITKFREGR
ncbi:MAG: hypothetical protein LCH63_00365 [Candidatus Melainabacteria bacterium]|nr:hypothetical protein [Candidatus Melainabacteria bacterium]